MDKPQEKRKNTILRIHPDQPATGRNHIGEGKESQPFDYPVLPHGVAQG
jgi:hypothetical protein